MKGTSVRDNFRFNLQLFAEQDVDIPEGSDVGDAPDSDVDDVEYEDEGEDDLSDDEDDADGLIDPDVEDEDAEDLPEANATKTEEKTPLFDKKQQEAVNKVVEARLERQESKFIKDLSKMAGTEIELSEVQTASKLWGLLKTNPELSQAIDGVIDHYLSNGKAKAPTELNQMSKEQAFALKEAVLDLKIADRVFNKHADKILTWADDNGIDVTSPKELKLAYMAWKGSQAPLIEATKKVSEQKKTAVKTEIKKRAVVQSGKSAIKGTRVDYGKMTDTAILAHTGMKLFTDD